MVSLPGFRLLPLRFSKQSIEKERRKHPRVASYHLLKFIPENGPTYQHLSNLVNISETGLQFFSTEWLEPNSFIRIVLNLTEPEKQIPVTGKLIWIHPNGQGHKGYYAGLVFLDLTEEDRGVIQSFVSVRSSD